MACPCERTRKPAASRNGSCPRATCSSSATTATTPRIPGRSGSSTSARSSGGPGCATGRSTPSASCPRPPTPSPAPHRECGARRGGPRRRDRVDRGARLRRPAARPRRPRRGVAGRRAHRRSVARPGRSRRPPDGGPPGGSAAPRLRSRGPAAPTGRGARRRASLPARLARGGIPVRRGCRRRPGRRRRARGVRAGDRDGCRGLAIPAPGIRDFARIHRAGRRLGACRDLAGRRRGWSRPAAGERRGPPRPGRDPGARRPRGCARGPRGDRARRAARGRGGRGRAPGIRGPRGSRPRTSPGVTLGLLIAVALAGGLASTLLGPRLPRGAAWLGLGAALAVLLIAFAVGPDDSLHVGTVGLAGSPTVRLVALGWAAAAFLLAVIGRVAGGAATTVGPSLIALGASVLALGADDPSLAFAAPAAGGVAVILAPTLGAWLADHEEAPLTAVAVRGAGATVAAGLVGMLGVAWSRSPAGPFGGGANGAIDDAGFHLAIGLTLLAMAAAVVVRSGAIPAHLWAARFVGGVTPLAVPGALGWSSAAFTLAALGWSGATVAQGGVALDDAGRLLV